MTMETTSFTSSHTGHSRQGIGVVSKIASQAIGLVAKAATYFETRRQQVTNRLAFKNLLTLEANILQDIGVTREDVIWASKLPLSQNAALELDKVARANRIMRF